MDDKPKVVSLGNHKTDNSKFIARHLHGLANQFEKDSFGPQGTPDAVIVIGVYRDQPLVMMEGMDPTSLLHPLMIRGALVSAIDQTYEAPIQIEDPEGH